MTTRREFVCRAVGTTLLMLMAATTWAADPADARKFREPQQGQPPGPKLSPDDRRELREMRRERQRERFDEADRDHDRALSKDETAKVAPRLHDKFEDIDSNRDGRATPDEIRSFKRERAKMRRIERGGADPRF